MSDLLRDIRFGLRSLRRAPAVAIVALLTLALGIGANTAIFSVLNGVLMQPLPYREPARLVQVWDWATISKEVLERLRAESRTLDGITGYYVVHRALTGQGEPEQLTGVEVAANHFTVLGPVPLLGRTFTPGEERPGGGKVVILGHDLWQRRYAGDPRIVGRRIDLAGAARTVVGVMPADFRPLRRGVEFWMPHLLDPSNPSDYSGMASISVVARLAPGVGAEQATAELQAIAGRISVEVGGAYDAEWARRAIAVPLREATVADVAAGLWMLSGAVLCVLLIACANVANLLLARGGARGREIAIRLGLGAGRGRVLRQLLTESALLGLAGGLAGVGVAWLMLDVLGDLLPASLPRTESIAIDGPVLGFALLVSLASSLLFGIAPALRATQGSITDSLKDGGRSATAGAHGLRLHRALIVAEVALAVVVMAGAGLLLRSVWNLIATHVGFDPTHVVTLRVLVPDASRNAEPALRAAFFNEVDRRVNALPGVQRAGFVTYLPMTSGIPSASYERPDRPNPAGAPRPYANFQLATPGYFDAMGIPLLRGRLLAPTDRHDAPQVGVINDVLARVAFGDDDPLGRTIEMFGGGAHFTVVGVVVGSRQYRPDRRPEPEVYLAHDQLRWMPSMFLAVRAAGDPTSLVASIRHAIRQIDENVPISDVHAMEHVVSRSTGRERFFASLLLGFGALALLLGALGVYGVLSYVVSRRRQEIGLRIALGASPRHVLRGTLGWAMRPVLGGIALGTVGGFAATRVLGGMLYGVSATDPLTFAAVPALLAAVAVAAGWLPARRAARTDPLRSLRGD